MQYIEVMLRCTVPVVHHRVIQWWSGIESQLTLCLAQDLPVIKLTNIVNTLDSTKLEKKEGDKTEDGEMS